jgi:uncharacterized protein
MTDPALEAAVGSALLTKLDAAETRLHELGSALVALSGGADSALVVALARRALGSRVEAAMGVSAAYPAEELASARSVCALLDVRLHEVPTGQLEDADFLRNDGQRCFHCRDDLYGVLAPLAAARGLAAICDGTNVDDLGEHRPGLRAARQAGVISPLAGAGITKAEVRSASRALGLPTWDKPQQACLSSRIPRGTPITMGALHRVEQAERWLRQQGFRQLRVREHGDVARLELPEEDIARLAEEPLRGRCVAALRGLGYAFVSLDLEPFATGRLSRIGAGSDGNGAPSEP